MLKLFSLLLILFTFSCKSQDCDTLPDSFNNYQEATQIISDTNFHYSDNVSTSKSSWIRTAKYYSCDEAYGFLILVTDKKDYIFQDVPLGTWKGFKNADSFGKYYNNYIRNMYQLKIK